MKFLADVNIAQSVISFLRGLGHEVLDSKKEHLLSPDIRIIELAQNEKLIILTRDKDFLELVKHTKYQIPMIIFRLPNQKPDNIIKHLKQFLLVQTEKIIENSSTIITEESAIPKEY